MSRIRMVERVCEFCGETFKVRDSLRFFHEQNCCRQPECLERKSQKRDRQIVRAWECMNSGIPDGHGFFVPHLEDKHGRFRPWYKLPHLRDLAKEYRIYERIAALNAAGKKRGSGEEVNAR